MSLIFWNIASRVSKTASIHWFVIEVQTKLVCPGFLILLSPPWSLASLSSCHSLPSLFFFYFDVTFSLKAMKVRQHDETNSPFQCQTSTFYLQECIIESMMTGTLWLRVRCDGRARRLRVQPWGRRPIMLTALCGRTITTMGALSCTLIWSVTTTPNEKSSSSAKLW